MGRRVCYWVGYTLVFGGVVPLLLVFAFAALAAEDAPTMTGAFGTGEAFLVAVAWLAAGIAELREAPNKRKSAAAFCHWASTLFLFLTAVAYGFVRGNASSAADAVMVASLTVVAMSGILSTIAVALGTPE